MNREVLAEALNCSSSVGHPRSNRELPSTPDSCFQPLVGYEVSVGSHRRGSVVPISPLHFQLWLQSPPKFMSFPSHPCSIHLSANTCCSKPQQTKNTFNQLTGPTSSWILSILQCWGEIPNVPSCTIEQLFLHRFTYLLRSHFYSLRPTKGQCQKLRKQLSQHETAHQFHLHAAVNEATRSIYSLYYRPTQVLVHGTEMCCSKQLWRSYGSVWYMKSQENAAAGHRWVIFLPIIFFQWDRTGSVHWQLLSSNRKIEEV